MKKTLSVTLLAAALVCGLTGCASNSTTGNGNPTVTFNLVGGNVGGNTSPIKITVKEGETLDNIPAPQKASFDFGGWYTELYGVGKQFAETTTVTSDIAVYANWKGGTIECGTTDRISIANNEFVVNGKRIWINGANTPWDKWNDFGGRYNDSWWNNHFGELRQAGVNAIRVWINCNNDNGAIQIDNNGMVSGASRKHWDDLDAFFATAERNQIYIMATLLSFDHFKTPNGTQARPDATKWRAMIQNKTASASFVENYTIPFVERYRDNPWLWSIDLCNEPDWIFETAECGKLPWDHISYLFAISAAAIHENSNILVTVGMSFPKYNADGNVYEGNKVSDTFLQNLYSNQQAYLDFWSPHYYDWVGEWYGVPHYLTPSGIRGGNKTTGWTGGWGLDPSKPALLGECSAKGTGKNLWGVKDNTIITDYEQAYLNGWQGVMPWTSNGVDANGTLADFSPATMNMLTKYPGLIFP